MIREMSEIDVYFDLRDNNEDFCLGRFKWIKIKTMNYN